MSGTSTNPLDDLVPIFGNTSLSSSGVPIPSAVPAPAIDPLGGFGGPSAVPAPAIDPLGGFGGVSQATAVPSTASNQQEDLLGLF